MKNVNSKLLEIISFIESGKNVIDIIAPSFVLQLNTSLIKEGADLKELPLFLKTLLYYKILPKDVFLKKDILNLSSGEILPLIQNNLNLIQDGISILDIFIDSKNENFIKTLISASDFKVHIANVHGGKFKGASHPHFMGLIFLNLENLLDESDIELSIVHELAHQELFLINMMDRLVNSSTNPKLIHSPYQGKGRPPIGRLHSAHALYRMIYHLENKNIGSGATFKRYLAETVDSFQNDELTEFGLLLIEVYRRSST